MQEALIRALREDVSDERVLAAIGQVPRERFVAPELQDMAYEDRPLPIGHGQTISQPRIIGMMLQELHLRGREKALEIGTGSGYQAAVLSKLAMRVVTVERIPELAVRAGEVLRELHCDNVTVHLSHDGLGWPEDGPYDAIVVAAAAPRIPQTLVDQLAAGGRLVIPVGGRAEQDLMVVERRPEGLTVARHGGCRFVPLIDKEAFSPESAEDPAL